MQNTLQIYPVHGQKARQNLFDNWMAVDVETKYLFNGVPYVGKDESRLENVSAPTSVVMKLMSPLFGRGYNVTCDNYFTSLHLLLRLVHERCSIVGTICRNRKKVLEVLKTTRPLHETIVLKINQINCCDYNDIPVQEVQICKYFEYSLFLCYNPRKRQSYKKGRHHPVLQWR